MDSIPTSADSIIFPDDRGIAQPTEISVRDHTTAVAVVDQTNTTVAVVVIVVFLLVIAAVAGFVYFLRKRKQGKDSPDIGAIDSPISRLGMQYEVESLLSVNTVEAGRKISVSEKQDKEDRVEELEKCLTENLAYGSGVRVSKYIDSGSTVSVIGRKYSESSNQSETKESEEPVVENTDEVDGFHNTSHLDKRLGLSTQYLEAMAPIAGEESNPASRPLSAYAPIPEDTELLLSETATLDRLKHQQRRNVNEKRIELPEINISHPTTRPYSQIIVTQHYSDNMKSTMHGAQSENSLFDSGHPANYSSRSDSHLPPLPPKLVPLLPPKQAINKSKEDMEKINKAIIRSSADIIGNFDQEDYDLPSGKDDHELQDYDEPPINHSQAHLDIQRSFGEGLNESFEDSRYFCTPRREYDEDYEDEETFFTPNQTWANGITPPNQTPRIGITPPNQTPTNRMTPPRSPCPYQDYDEPVQHNSRK